MKRYWNTPLTPSFVLDLNKIFQALSYRTYDRYTTYTDSKILVRIHSFRFVSFHYITTHTPPTYTSPNSQQTKIPKMIRDVWFWLPFHMLQAYPMVRNLPLNDLMIPFAHLMWVVMYLAEHWAGLAEPVEAAFAFSAKFGTPFSGILLLSFFFNTFRLSSKKLVVGAGFVLYIGFMTQAKNFGLIGSPKKDYYEQIDASADHQWNNDHVILHVWYITILWVVSLTVPYDQLKTRGKDLKSAPGGGLGPVYIIALLAGGAVWVTVTVGGMHLA